MNLLPPNDSREALEARITALILGELSSPDAAELELRIAADPELVALRHRLQKAANLLREACASAESGSVSSAPAEKLSQERRQVLLARFKTLKPTVMPPPKKQRPSWIMPMALAACVIAIAGGLLLPALDEAKPRSRSAVRLHEEKLAALNEAQAGSAIDFVKPAEQKVEESRRRFSEVNQTATAQPSANAPSGVWDDARRKVPTVLSRSERGTKQVEDLTRERIDTSSSSSFGIDAPAPTQPDQKLFLGNTAVNRETAGRALKGTLDESIVLRGSSASSVPAVTAGETLNYGYVDRQMAGQAFDSVSPGDAYGYFGAKDTTVAGKEFAETASADASRDWFLRQQLNGAEAQKELGYPVRKLKADGAVTLADIDLDAKGNQANVRYDTLNSLGDSLDVATGQTLEKTRAEERFVGALTKPIELAKSESAGDKSEPAEAFGRRYGLEAGAASATTRSAGRVVAGEDRSVVVPETPAASVPLSAGLSGGQAAPLGSIAPVPSAVPARPLVRLKPAKPSLALAAPVIQNELGLVTNSMTGEGLTLPAQESEVLRVEVKAIKAQDAPPARQPAPAPTPQPEVATAENAFSTFSLNVSDVSFRLATTALGNGQMPDVSTIRSEEFVNAFDYRDPSPAPEAPVAMTWERARYPFAHNRDLVRIAVKTAGTGRETGRALNLVLLLDNSGSMERADRVAIIREALRVLGTKLQPQDKLTVITFSRTPMLRISGLSGTAAAKVLPELEGLTPEGGTNLEEAMRAAYASAMRHYIAGGMNRVVLMTDGAANLGDIDPERLRATVEEHRKKGIALDCFGIGFEGYDDQMLEALSRNGDGRYAFINSPEAAATEFAGKLAGALQIAASDVKVQVEFNAARVNVYRQIGYAKHQLKKEQFRDNTVDAAEIAALESGNALYTVELKPDGTGPIGTVRVRYKVPGTSTYHEYEWAMPYTGNAPSLAQSSPALRLAATAAGFAEWLVGSPWAGEVTTDGLISLMQGIPQHYAPDARPTRLLEAIRQAKSISGR